MAPKKKKRTPRRVSAKRAEAVCEKYRPLLLAVPGVEWVCVGVKQTKGKYPGLKKQQGTLCIIVYVSNKPDSKTGPEQAKLQEAGMIPADLDGVPTDVVQRPPVRLAARPLVGSLEIGRVDKGGASIADKGTLGLIVQDEATNKPMVLTCAHVAFAEPMLPTQESLYEPAILDPAHLVAADTKAFHARSALNHAVIDGAVVPLTQAPPDHEFRSIVSLAKSIAPPDAAVSEMNVAFISPVTGKRHSGHVVTTSDEAKFPRVGQLGKLIKISGNQGAFARPGDSGAIVFTESKDGTVSPVGMIVGIEEKVAKPHAYAHHLSDTLKALGVKL